MKNNYGKLKFRLLLQTMLVIVLTILVGFIIFEIFLQDSSTELVKMLTSIHVQEDKARAWYWRVIGNNKEIVMIAGFLLIFLVFFYIALNVLEKYLREIEAGINNITSDSKESIRMTAELEPIETRLTEIKGTLKKQELEVLLAEQKKNDLIVYLAHDLKTPLTSIVAYLSMLDSYKDMPEEERSKYIHIALEKSTRLGELIDEFFDITKFNLQEIELEKQELNLTMMLEQVADEFYGVFQKKGLNCELEVADDLTVNGDADKLARVFDNILRNAVSYCYPDTPIQIQAKRIGEEIRICFTNKGDMIPKQKLQIIFEKFYRLDEARRSKTGGAGLGLAIAKKIVELHDGTIEARSDETETRFIVTLPSSQLPSSQIVYFL